MTMTMMSEQIPLHRDQHSTPWRSLIGVIEGAPIAERSRAGKRIAGAWMRLDDGELVELRAYAKRKQAALLRLAEGARVRVSVAPDREAWRLGALDVLDES
jgi:hypothetical protein